MKSITCRSLWALKRTWWIICLSGCTSVINGNPYGFCPVEVHASPIVKADLNKKILAPDTVKYLRDIGNQQRDIEKYCK